MKKVCCICILLSRDDFNTKLYWPFVFVMIFSRNVHEGIYKFFRFFPTNFLELETIFHLLEFAIFVHTLDKPSQFI